MAAGQTKGVGERSRIGTVAGDPADGRAAIEAALLLRVAACKDKADRPETHPPSRRRPCVDCAGSLTRSLVASRLSICRPDDENLRRRSKSIAPKRTIYFRFLAALLRVVFFADFFAADFVFDFAFFAMLLS